MPSDLQINKKPETIKIKHPPAPSVAKENCLFCKDIKVNGDKTLVRGDFVFIVYDPNNTWGHISSGVVLDDISNIEIMITGKSEKRHGYKLQRLCPSCNRKLSDVITL